MVSSKQSQTYRKDSGFQAHRQNAGQIVLEYILILVIAVAAATLLTRGLVARGDNPGIIINKWNQLNNMIGLDESD